MKIVFKTIVTVWPSWDREVIYHWTSHLSCRWCMYMEWLTFWHYLLTINQSKQIYIVPCVASESEARDVRDWVE